MKVKFDLYIKEGSGTKGPRKNASQCEAKGAGGQQKRRVKVEKQKGVQFEKSNLYVIVCAKI